jgi:hypothetical protein
MATGDDILRFYQNLFAEYAKGGRKSSAFTLSKLWRLVTILSFLLDIGHLQFAM